MTGKIELELYSSDARVARASLPGRNGAVRGGGERGVRLEELLPGYEGPEVRLKFGENDELIRIAILSEASASERT